MQLVITAVIISAVGLAHLCSAQMACNGVLSGIINNDVTCAGDCVLDSAFISGNVLCSTGTLLAKGSSTISGNILTDGTVTRVELDAVNVSGIVQVLNANSLNEIVIRQTATLNLLNVNNSPANVDVSGLLNTIELVNAGNLAADDLTTTGGILISRGSGIIEICGSSIGGSLSVGDHSGDINVGATIVNCDPTTITGGIIVQRGIGDVTVSRANLPSGDIIILENTGTIILDRVQVSDLKLTQNTGALSLSTVATDSDVQITGHKGNMLLSTLNIVGDANINNVEGMVTLIDSNFNLEDISITLVSQDVTVQNNINLSMIVAEVDGAVLITQNTITVANVNKNTGGVEISNNNIITLSCSDNTPAPTGSGNNVNFPDGQCATL